MTFEEYEIKRNKERETAISFLESGVEFANIDTVYIEEGAKIGKGTYIGPNVTISSDSVIGENCRLIQDVRLEKAVIGNGTTIEHAVILSSSVGDNTNVGPFTYIRPGSSIGNNCKVGDFVEVKNSTMGDGSKAAHLSYLGDGDIGRDVNIGCGTVFVNYDGTNKYRTVIGDRCFIGCNANLIAPIELEDGAYVAAGSTINRNVPEDSLAVARSKQTNLEGWAKKSGLYNK